MVWEDLRRFRRVKSKILADCDFRSLAPKSDPSQRFCHSSALLLRKATKTLYSELWDAGLQRSTNFGVRRLSGKEIMVKHCFGVTTGG